MRTMNLLDKHPEGPVDPKTGEMHSDVKKDYDDAVKYLQTGHNLEELMYGSGDSFNALAAMMTVQSFQPGGITMFDVHWEGETHKKMRSKAAESVKEPAGPIPEPPPTPSPPEPSPVPLMPRKKEIKKLEPEITNPPDDDDSLEITELKLWQIDRVKELLTKNNIKYTEEQMHLTKNKIKQFHRYLIFDGKDSDKARDILKKDNIAWQWFG